MHTATATVLPPFCPAAMNQAFSLPSPVSPVPVLPITRTPLMAALPPMPLVTQYSMMSHSSLAACEPMACPRAAGAVLEMTLPSWLMTLSTM